MPRSIPKQGVKAYMDSMVRQNAPGNGWWKFGAWFFDTWRALVIVPCLTAVVMALLWNFDVSIVSIEPSTSASFRFFFSAVIIVGIPFLILVFLAAGLVKGPGGWERYSFKDFADVYDWDLPDVSAEVRRVRTELPEAEFELAVLDLEDQGGPISIVLFQVLDDLNSHQEYEKDGGKPLAILYSPNKTKLEQIQFGDMWVPYEAT